MRPSVAKPVSHPPPLPELEPVFEVGVEFVSEVGVPVVGVS